MSEFFNVPLETVPDCAIEVSNGVIVGVNSHTKQEFPSLHPPCPLPSPLSALLESKEPSGTAFLNGHSYTWGKITGHTSLLLLIRPFPMSSLNDEQITGLLHQTRSCMQEILLELQTLSAEYDNAPAVVECVEHINKNYCRALRLLSNTQFLQQMGLPSGIVYHPIAMDAVAFCRQFTSETAGLLKLAGYELQFDTTLSSLLMPGDPALLRKLFYTLVSNAVKATPPSVPVQFTLEKQQGRGVFTFLNEIAPSRLACSRKLPLPNDGAGMGLPIAQHIVFLHKGTLLWDTQSEQQYRTVVSLPLSPMPKSLSVHTPKLEQDFGFPLALIELSDLLPSFLYHV